MSSLYDESLGIQPVINAAATYTKLGGSIMPDEVRAAMTAAAQFVRRSLRIAGKSRQTPCRVDPQRSRLRQFGSRRRDHAGDDRLHRRRSIVIGPETA